MSPSHHRSKERADRILFIVTEFGRGGAETQILRIGTELRRNDWRVSVLSLMPPEGYVTECAEAGIALETLGMRRGRPSALALARAYAIVRRERPAIMVSFLPHAVILGALVGPPMNVPIRIASVRDSEFGGRRHLRLLRLLAHAGVYQRVVTNSSVVCRQLVERDRIAEAALVVIPNAIDVPAPLSLPRRRWLRETVFGAADADFQFLAAGNFRPNKDYPNLMTAFAEAAATDERVRLAVAGKGAPPRELLDALASPLGKRIRLLGQRTDVRELVAAADALVLSSAVEGMPNVVMESLVAGTPVVATNVDGVPELVRDGVTGLLVPARDSHALARAMLSLAKKSDAERRGMGETGRADMVARFNVTTIAGTWATLFASSASVHIARTERRGRTAP